jgi:aryl-alcohol dehydrogenase-like predicted oxidoreductase
MTFDLQQTIALGPGGPQVKPLGIGAWSWGDTLFWNYGKDYGVEEVRSAFEAAIASGVTFFRYGGSLRTGGIRAAPRPV